MPGHKGIRSLDWVRVESVFVAAPQHPICMLPQPLGDAVIKQYRSVIIRDTSQHQPALSRGILSEDHFKHVENMAQKIQAHQAGLGVGFVPRFRVEPLLQSGELIALTVVNAPLAMHLKLGWKISNRGQACRWLVEHLQALDIVS